MRSAPTYLALNPDCSLRLLEEPCIYDRARDELYELDREGCNFVQNLPLPADSKDIERVDGEFLEYCREEGILCHAPGPFPQRRCSQSPIPSLRYLLLHITTRCNLECAHCFLGDTRPLDMPLDQIVRAMEQFDEMQGLRLLISGGEPLLHPGIWDLNEYFDRFSFRTVILSNGTTLADPHIVERLRAQEVQVSLDGVGISHDILRGTGTYEKSLRGLENLVASGIDVSVATMAHAKNLGDFDALEKIVRSLGAKEWNIDMPAHAGRWSRGGPLEAHPEIAGSVLKRAYGGGAHYSSNGDWACGAHLCAVMTDGTICKCGFYADLPSGALADGLARGWEKIPRTKIGQLRCDCDIVGECRGGCRYRAEIAGDRFGKDPVMCAANGLPC